MKLQGVLFIIAFCAAAVFGQAKCFQNDGLKDRHRITMAIEGRKVSGNFSMVREYDEDKKEDYPFTGTKALDVITVHFTPGRFPDELSSKARRITWTLSNAGGKESLKVKIYGMKYDKGLYETYSADYEACETEFDKFVKGARSVDFAKDATTARVTVTFTRKDEHKAFIVNVSRVHPFSVRAPGCGITFFYPDKTGYEEGTAIDTLGIPSPKLSGDYLFVISPAGEPGKCDVEFEQHGESA